MDNTTIECACDVLMERKPFSVLEIQARRSVCTAKHELKVIVTVSFTVKGHPESKRVVNPFTVACSQQHMKMQNSHSNNKR